MGIKEVYDELKTEDRHRKFAGYNDRSKREHDVEWAKQVILLRELQTLGIISLIEEFTGEKMEMVEREGKVLVGYDKPWYDWWKETDSDKLDEIDEKVKAGLVWGWEISSPHLSRDTQQWHQSLRIVINQVDDGMVPSLNGLDSHAVLLAYSPTRELHIMGKETTYKGPLPEDPTARTKLIERKLAEALLSPMTYWAKMSTLYPDTFGKKG